MTGASVPTGRPRDPRDGTRILLVEKRGSLRRLLRRVLEDAGHDVLTATDIQAGLSRLARSDDPVDVLVADAADTGSFGAAGPLEELIDRIRKLRPECRVILVSGGPSRVLSHPYGPWIRHLARPFNLDELVRTVEEALSEGVPGSGIDSGSEGSPVRIGREE